MIPQRFRSVRHHNHDKRTRPRVYDEEGVVVARCTSYRWAEQIADALNEADLRAEMVARFRDHKLLKVV